MTAADPEHVAGSGASARRAHPAGLRFVDAQHFQPEGMLIGFVPLQVGAFHLSLLSIAFGEID
jgi:hypothetical protein